MEKLRYCIDLSEATRRMLGLIGAKAANLGELSALENIQVPSGFCLTTAAYKEVTSNNPLIISLQKKLDDVNIHDRKQVGAICEKIRQAIEELSIPPAITEEITTCLSRSNHNTSFAIRSSATAEDLPGASFAGQQDSWLNISGKEEILKHIRKCWASLYTDRAVIYRMQHGFDHKTVWLAVIIQEMVLADAAGIMFTADPVTSNRKLVSIDAGFGLGEALVAGLVNADNYKVRDGVIVEKKISAKQLAIYPAEQGGTIKQEPDGNLQNKQVLSDAQIIRLEKKGRKIEAWFGSPQDIEWCLAGDNLYIVQSRPVTTLFPIPEANDEEEHVYISVGHQQMMTDAMKPLGLSLFTQTAGRGMYQAGGRLFVDIAKELASPEKRHMMVNVLGKSDPLFKDALKTILDRKAYAGTLPEMEKDTAPGNGIKETAGLDYETLKDYDPSVVTELIQNNETSLEKLKEEIRLVPGPELIGFIRQDLVALKTVLFDPRGFGVIMTAMNAYTWLNEKILLWLGEKNVADKLAQSVPNNITSEMGLALLDVADTIRPYTQVVDYLKESREDDFLVGLSAFEGGKEAEEAIRSFLEKYGMRCVGEIDITRPRWAEKPAMLLPVILSNIRNFESGAGKRKFDEGLAQAAKMEKEILERLKALPEGEQKAAETKRMIKLLRELSGYREYPKYHKICRYLVYKQALMKEAKSLQDAGILQQDDDIFYLNLEELEELFRRNKKDDLLIEERKVAFRAYGKLVPPRVITSDGEIITGSYNRENLPAGAIVGLAVSAGIIEGRARVILDMGSADLEPGDILVTTFTDPSWTPLFVSIKGLITEVGGLMTHGAVIAREYGLAAVVGVENATQLIKDGQRIRLNGTDGYVELL
ncbi:MAG: phosphoenolpyruvate synthase [Chitinophagaceae bacterium]|nr:phosphoenolpyruvate synthase [Chitinophagaceae bacterium]